MHVQILLYDGFDELDALAPYEVLQLAKTVGADLSTELVTLDGADEITASHGLRLKPQARLDAGRRPQVLLVPGGNWVSRAPKGARAEAERGTTPAALADHHRAGVTLAAVCTGSMLLAAAGLLRGRPAVTHHLALD